MIQEIRQNSLQSICKQELMKRYKEVKVDCFKTSQNLYSEIFTDINKRELDKELDNFAKVGYDKLIITIDGKKQTLVLTKHR